MPLIQKSCGCREDLQPKPSNASRRRQSRALFGYDSCDCCTASLKLMPDDARRPARLQGRDVAEDAMTTHPCIRGWLGMLAEEPWEYSMMGRMKLNACTDTTGRFLLVSRCTEARRSDSGRRGYICCGDRSQHACKILDHLICRGT